MSELQVLRPGLFGALALIFWKYKALVFKSKTKAHYDWQHLIGFSNQANSSGPNECSLSNPPLFKNGVSV